MANSIGILREFFETYCRYLFICGLFIALTPGWTTAQRTATDGTTPLALSPGAPAGSYALSGFETVNAYNGSLNFRLPLVQMGGRGTAAYTLSLPLEQHWRVVHKSNDNQMIELPTINWWTPNHLRYGAGHLDGRVATDSSSPCPPLFHVTSLLSRLTFTTPDGTEYELRDQLTGGRPQTYFCGGTEPYPSRGTVFVTADGTAATFISDTTIRDDGSALSPSGYLSLRDGTRYRIDKGEVSWFRDRNGNKIRFSYAPLEMIVTDQLNRQVTVSYADFRDRFYDEILYNGFGGAQRSIRINYALLADVLRTNRRGDLDTVQTPAALFPQLTGSTSNRLNPYVFSSVVLPDEVQQYQFLYNVYGELARVTLPTGGAFEYDFGSGTAADPTGVIWSAYSLPEIYRRILQRRVYSDGSTLESLTTYSRPEVEGGYQIDHFKNDETTLLARERHYFHGSALNSFNQDALDYPAWRDGKEYQTESYAANGQTLLRKVTQNWEQRSLYWWTGNPDFAPPNNPYIKDSLTVLPDTGQVTKTTHVNPQNGQTMIDQFNNITDTWVYDYGLNTPGSLLSHTHTDYLSANNGIDYTSRTSLSSPHLLSLPTRQSTFDAGGIERARTTFEYDNYAGTDSYHAGLKDWPLLTGVPITGLEASFTPSYPYRGNVTATTRYLLANNQVAGSISGYTQYDLAGNIVKSIDARSTPNNIIATTVNYDDCFGAPDAEARTNNVPASLATPLQRTYAFPTVATNALGHKVYTQFDYSLGRSVDAEDANGTVFSGYYNDVLDRPTRLVKASNRDVSFQSKSVFNYDDINHILTTLGDLDSFGDQVLKNQVLYDGLGRTVETRQYEGGGNYIAARQLYDSLGRVYKSSNPFRPWKVETPEWNTTGFDALNRITSLTTADGATASTSYYGSEVTATDQIGKQKKSVSDALGRLTKIYEDPNGVNWLTSYEYDVLGDLTKVIQGGQTRNFLYDSLARMTSATNPESGTSTFTYDNNGNLLTRTDARGILTTVPYDALNRPISKTYQNDPAATPPVNYFYDGQALPSGAPSGFPSGFSTGRLVAVTYGSGASTGDYFGYDVLGRSVLKIQRTGSTNYQTSAVYNVSGRPTSVTYPSGHSLSYNYDPAGRLGDQSAQNPAMAGNLGDGVTRSYSSAISYNNRNELAQEKLGTDTPIYNKLFYNSRGQLSEIRESTNANNTTWDRGAIINHYSDQCWGMCAGQNMTDNNGNLKKQENWIPDNEQGYPHQTYTQLYRYDDLNRLQDVRESHYSNDANPIQTWTQAYAYDRYGNRSINQAGTTPGVGINNTAAAVVPNTTTNRSYAPGETEVNHPLINYDPAGNQTKDYYSVAGVRYDRSYDAESRMMNSTATDSFGNLTSSYTYDGNGARVRRIANNQETWQVYGIGGELLAEYAANGSAATPKKEYGYRNGQLLVTTAQTSTGGTAGPVGYWKFDENTGTTTADSSGNGHPGTLNSGATWGSGQSGSAVSLDGVNDYVQVGTYSSLSITNAGSFAAWIYPTGQGSNSTYGGTIVGKEGEYLINRAANGHLYWAFSNSNPGWAWHDTGATVSPNQWTHVAVVYDGGVIKSYVNGTLMETYSGSGSITDADNGAYNDFRIGSRQDSLQHFQGRIDEVRIYNRVLSASEVSAFVGTAGSGPVGYWKFDENTESTTADSSGNGHPGTLNSGATWGSGQSGSAVSLDGVNDYVQVGTYSSLSITNAGSFAAWIYPTGQGSNATYGGTIVGKEGEYLINRAANGHLYWAFSNSNPGWSWHDTGITVSLNQWTHVAVVYDAGVIKTYINGTLLETYAGSGSITDADNGAYNDFRIGSRQDSLQHFQGRIDELRIYNRALSASEVSAFVGTSGSGPVGHWKFDENTGSTTADSSGNGHPGTLNSGATWGSGQSGSAVSLDGVNDYVQVGAYSSLSISNAGTFTAWIYPTGQGSNSTYGGTIVGKEGEYLINRAANGHLYWAFSNSNPGWAWHDTGITVSLNQWTHVAVVYDGGVIKTYVNGTLMETYSGSGSITDADNGTYNDLRIGSRQDSLQHFQGRIDEVRIYNRVLNGGEVTALHAGQVAALPNDLSGSSSADVNVEIQWLVSDQLGTPRMVFDQSGSLANMKRHDYLPFGEDLPANVGLRTSAQGYSVPDGIRQQFTEKERDSETGLDYFLARYYSSTHGRFTSPDPLHASGRVANPQTWNRYAYVLNNPLAYVDPTGLAEQSDPQKGQQAQPTTPPATASPLIPLQNLQFNTLEQDQPQTAIAVSPAANAILNQLTTDVANNVYNTMVVANAIEQFPRISESEAISYSLSVGQNPNADASVTKQVTVRTTDVALGELVQANDTAAGKAIRDLSPMVMPVGCRSDGEPLGKIEAAGGGNMAARLAQVARDKGNEIARATYKDHFPNRSTPQAFQAESLGHVVFFGNPKF